MKKSDKNKWYDATVAEIMAEANSRAFIPDDRFVTVLNWAYIPTTDFILTCVHGGKKLFMLVRRSEGSWKGQYFVPGGRMAPYSLPDESVRENCQRELGFAPEKAKFIGHLNVLNPERTKGRKPWFSLWHLYTIRVSWKTRLVLNNENADVQWFEHIEPRFPAPVIQALKMAGFKEK